MSSRTDIRVFVILPGPVFVILFADIRRSVRDLVRVSVDVFVILSVTVFARVFVILLPGRSGVRDLVRVGSGGGCS